MTSVATKPSGTGLESAASDNARFQSAQAAGLTIAEVGRLKLKWSYGFDGDISAFAQAKAPEWEAP